MCYYLIYKKTELIPTYIWLDYKEFDWIWDLNREIFPTWGSATESFNQSIQNNVISSTVKMVPIDFGITQVFILD